MVVYIQNFKQCIFCHRKRVVDILPSAAKALLGIFCNSNCIHRCRYTMLRSSSNLNIAEWLVSIRDERTVKFFSPSPVLIR